jgi:MFS family permease
MSEVTADAANQTAPVPVATPRRRLFADPLWRNRDFVTLWTGQTLSQVGSQVTVVAIPLIALNALHAGPQAMGYLQALGRLPFLLYLFAGVWVDRTARRPVMIVTDVGRAVLLVAVLVAAVTDVLTFWMLAVAVLLSMLLSVWFDTAYMTAVPSIVPREQLIGANTRLESSRSAAQLIGPTAGGALVQALTAPVAIAVDAVSFVASAVLVRLMRTPEPAHSGQGLSVKSILASLVEGLRFVFGHRLLRPLAVAIAFNNLAWAAELSLYFIFLVRTVHLEPVWIGITLAAGGPGALVGSMAARRVRERFGESVAIIGGLAVFAAAAALIPLAAGGKVLEVPMLMLAAFFMSAGGQVCSVNVLTLRQSVTPNELLGRANATFRFVALGMSPLGALAGGLLGAAVGLRGALFAAIAGMFLAPVLLLFSPVRRARSAAE